jgi:hypothetical protein
VESTGTVHGFLHFPLGYVLSARALPVLCVAYGTLLCTAARLCQSMCVCMCMFDGCLAPLDPAVYRTKTGPALLRGAKIDCIETFVPFGGPDPILLMPTRKDAAKPPQDPVNAINMRENGARARAREKERGNQRR